MSIDFSPVQDRIDVASSTNLGDLNEFHEVGVEFVDHATEDFWEIVSWEQIGNYPADVILVDSRSGESVFDLLAEVDLWNALPAAQAGQIGSWYACGPYSYGRLAPTLEELATQLSASEIVTQ